MNRYNVHAYQDASAIFKSSNEPSKAMLKSTTPAFLYKNDESIKTTVTSNTLSSKVT